MSCSNFNTILFIDVFYGNGNMLGLTINGIEQKYCLDLKENILFFILVLKVAEGCSGFSRSVNRYVADNRIECIKSIVTKLNKQQIKRYFS